MSQSRMGRRNSEASTVRARLSAAISPKALQAARRRSSALPAPYSWLNTTPLPMHSPSSTLVSSTIRLPEEPTAARAVGPSQRLTIRVSATL